MKTTNWMWLGGFLMAAACGGGSSNPQPTTPENAPTTPTDPNESVPTTPTDPQQQTPPDPGTPSPQAGVEMPRDVMGQVATPDAGIMKKTPPAVTDGGVPVPDGGAVPAKPKKKNPTK
jgi:hypothetical protein